jgi:hypothetical protein
MAKGDQGFSRIPCGSTAGGYRRPRVQIGFDPETLDAILQLAEVNDRSFTAQVRMVLQDGLRLRAALEQSVKLQSHYAHLLNDYDRGSRLTFEDADAWIARLTVNESAGVD